MKEKIRTLHIPPKSNYATSKLESEFLSSESYDSNPEFMFAQTNDPKNKSIPKFRIYCGYCHESNHSVSNCFRKQ